MRCIKIILNIGIFIQVLGIGIVVTMLLSFWKTSKMEKLYVGIGSVMAITGIVGSFLVSVSLEKSLDRASARFYNDEQFMQWVLSKFNTFALWSLLLLSVVIVTSLLYIWMNRTRLTSDRQLGLTIVIVLLMIAFPIAAIIYGTGTINKQFDVAAYILTLSICELAILYIPLLCKRVLAKRAFNEINDI